MAVVQASGNRNTRTVGALFRQYAHVVVCFMAVSIAAPVQADETAAADAYDKGAEAYRAESFGEAAEWFEQAYFEVPTPEALILAARAHDRAGNRARAASLSLQFLVHYGHHKMASTAQELADGPRSQLVLVRVACDDCHVAVDGQVVGSEFMVEPDTDHTVVVRSPDGLRSEALVNGGAGTEQSLDAPAPPPAVVVEAAPAKAPIEAPLPTAVPEEGQSGSGVAPLVTYVALGATAALAVAGTVITLDAAGGVEDYEAAIDVAAACSSDCAAADTRARKLLEDGQGKETLATIAWVATGVAAVTTAGIALFLTDWGGDQAPDEPAGVQFGFAPPVRAGDPALLHVHGQF